MNFTLEELMRLELLINQDLKRNEKLLLPGLEKGDNLLKENGKLRNMLWKIKKQKLSIIENMRG